MVDFITSIVTTVSGIDLDSITKVATVIGGVIIIIGGYALKLLHSSAKDSKLAAEAMKVDFSYLNDEFKILMDNQAILAKNQEKIIRLSYEIRGAIGARTLPKR